MYRDRLNSTEEIASSAESERLVIEPAVKEYSQQFLLTQGDASLPCSTENEVWMTSIAMGREIL